jgi:hypothetical protein
MNRLLKKIYHRFVKDEKTKIFIRKTCCRIKVISDMLKREVFVPFVPIEHFYSPFPAIADIKNPPPPPHFEIPGIDLNTEEQFKLLDEIEPFYKELPFKDKKAPDLRYYFLNDAYSYSDAIFLYCMLRKLNPKRIIEAGSGFSSCVTLDTNELYFNNQINCSFVEPYPELLKSLIKENDNSNIRIYESKLQNVPLDVFMELKANDVLFIDSTHVAKFNSDVNYVIHKILPVLAEGVYIHFHDIFYPFEYPTEWLLEGRAWNEQYVLRAFLEYNIKFKIILFNTYLETIFREKLEKRFPLIFKNTGGSIWIKKL